MPIHWQWVDTMRFVFAVEDYAATKWETDNNVDESYKLSKSNGHKGVPTV